MPIVFTLSRSARAVRACFATLIESGALPDVQKAALQSLREFGYQVNLGRTRGLTTRPSSQSQKAVSSTLRAVFRMGGRKSMLGRSVAVWLDRSCLIGTGLRA